MSELKQTAVANCPEYPPFDIYAVPHYGAPEAMPQEISTLYQNVLMQTQALMGCELVIDPTKVSTSVNGQRIQAQAIKPVVADMYPSFAITKPDRDYYRPDCLMIAIDQVNPQNPEQVESYRYKIDEAGSGLSQLTIRPFVIQDGSLNFCRNTTTQNRQLTTGDLMLLDTLYGFINANLIIMEPTTASEYSRTNLANKLGCILRRLVLPTRSHS